MIKLAVTIKTPRLAAIRKVVEDVRDVNVEICEHFLKQIDLNIKRGGSIWEKFPPNQPSTTAKRKFQGKSPIAMFGLRGKFKYTAGKTQFTIFSTDRDVIRMQLGPQQNSWQITAGGGKMLAFPITKSVARGKNRSGSSYDWFFGKTVTHKGWKRRALLPPALEVGFYARKLIAQKIAEAQ